MRTTIDISESLMRRAWTLIKPKSKRELIERSLEALINREHLRRLASRVGRTSVISRRALLGLRRRG